MEVWEFQGGIFTSSDSWKQIGSEFMYSLYRYVGGPYRDFLIDAQITNWTGGNKILYIDLIYRNYTALDTTSGVRIMVADPDGNNESEAAYWNRIKGEKAGIETLNKLMLNNSLGEIEITVNWDKIENNSNNYLKYTKHNCIFIPERCYATPLSLQNELENINRELNNKISAGQKDKEIIPIEGKVEEVFPFRKWYSQPIVGVTYINKSEDPIVFNYIKTLLSSSRDRDNYTIKVYKAESSVWNDMGKYYTGINSYSDSRLTLVYTGINPDFQGEYMTISLDEAVILSHNESVFVLLISESMSNYYVQTPLGPIASAHDNAYPIIYSLSSNLDKPYFGYNEYSCVPPILILSTGYVTTNQLANEVKNQIEQYESENSSKKYVELYIPKNIYTTENLEMNLWFDSLIRGIDKGLLSPINWYLEPQLSGATVKERSLCINRGIQKNNLIINVYDIYGNYTTNVLSAVNTISKSAEGLVANVLWLGDSLEANGLISSPVRHLLDQNGGSNIKFVGTQGYSPNNHEAYGGYKFKNYSTEGWMIARFYVTNNTETFNIGDVYTISSSLFFTISEINISSGNGYVSGSLGNNVSIDSGFAQTGVLQKRSGTGSDTLTYTRWTQESSNPLWNNDTNKVDIAAYRDKLGLNDSTIDVVIIILGVNDCLGDLQTEQQLIDNSIKYAIELYNNFIEDNSKCKLIFNLPSICGNTKGGWGANYGANGHIMNYQKNIFTFRKLLLQYFDENATYPNAYVNIGGIAVDRYYGYALEEKAISNVITETEKVHINAVHPTNSGYTEYGNANYAMLLHVLQQK